MKNSVETGPGSYRVISVFCVVFICLAVGLSIQPGSAEPMAERERLREVEERIAEQEEELASARREEQNLFSEIEQIDQRLAETEAEKDEVESRLSRLQSEEKQLREQLSQLERELKATRSALGDYQDLFSGRLRQIYKFGRTGYLDLLFGARSWTEFIQRISYLSRIIQQDISVISGMEDTFTAYEAKRQELERRRNELAQNLELFSDLREKLASKQESIEKDRGQRERLLGEIQEEKELYKQSLEELRAVSRQLENLISEKQEAQTRDTEGRMGAGEPGRLLWPLDSERITSGYGWRTHPIHQTRSFHDGLDIAADSGAPIYAAAFGQVIFAGWAQGYGKTVILDHGEGISTLYAHASRLEVEATEYVEKGEVIARVGTTGYSTGPHLHFEVRRYGKPIDPMPFYNGEGRESR